MVPGDEVDMSKLRTENAPTEVQPSITNTLQEHESTDVPVDTHQTNDEEGSRTTQENEEEE